MIVLSMSVFALFSLALLTLRTPLLVKEARKFSVGELGGEIPTVSIVIPARNEEHRIGKLLDSISNQSFAPHEVIVVDDQSTDETANIAKGHGATVVRSGERPTDCAPKAFVCDVGFKSSTGNVVLFLDADTYLAPSFVEVVSSFFSHPNKSVLSVQPFHRTSKLIVSLSFYLHFVSITASGLLSVVPFSLGLFGPCIALRRKAYEQSNGFANKEVKYSVIEDVELGEQLKKQGISIERYLGTGLIEYEMYTSFKHMFFGWIKNVSRGASQTNPVVLLAMIAYFGSMISIPFYLLTRSFEDTSAIYLLLQFVLLWLISINVAVRLGNYFISSVLYPFSLVFFLFVFLAASFSQLFGLKTRWAGRKLEHQRKH